MIGALCDSESSLAGVGVISASIISESCMAPLLVVPLPLSVPVPVPAAIPILGSVTNRNVLLGPGPWEYLCLMVL